MRVHGSATPDRALPGANDKDFALDRTQWFGFGLLGVLLTALTAVLFNGIRYEGKDVAPLVLLGLIFVVGVSLGYSRIRDFCRIRVRIESEHEKLEQANLALQQVDHELQSRLNQERLNHAEYRRLASAARTISSQFKSTFAPDKIAEFLAEGLGRELGADRVMCHSFDDALWPGFVKQWHRRAEMHVDESLFMNNELALSSMVRRLWNRKRVFNVPDSHLIDASAGPLPDLVAISKEFARSWVMAPVADGLSVLGWVSVTMVEDARVWSSA